MEEKEVSDGVEYSSYALTGNAGSCGSTTLEIKIITCIVSDVPQQSQYRCMFFVVLIGDVSVSVTQVMSGYELLM